jgi:hypothetical protein
MEQTKSYVKLYIIPADEYQSNTSLNHPVSVSPLILIPRFRLRPSFAEPHTLADRGMKMRLEVANVFAARGDARPPTSGGGLLLS